MDHGQESKSSLLETGTRIAQFIYFPSAFKDGTTFKGMVSTIDIAATILDFADIEPYEMDGVSWRGAIGNKQEEERWNENRCLAFEMSLGSSSSLRMFKVSHGHGFAVRPLRFRWQLHYSTLRAR